MVVYQGIGILYQLNRNTRRYVQVLQVGVPTSFQSEILINNAGEIFVADINGIYWLAPSGNSSPFGSTTANSTSDLFSSISQKNMALIAIIGLGVGILSFLFVILMLCCYKASKPK
jgi:hypothetical protein